jgi:hypothetical protein
VAQIQGQTGLSRFWECDLLPWLRQIDSPIDGHPNSAEGLSVLPGATGSLRQGPAENLFVVASG